jgi:hypothetical protein
MSKDQFGNFARFNIDGNSTLSLSLVLMGTQEQVKGRCQSGLQCQAVEGTVAGL